MEVEISVSCAREEVYSIAVYVLVHSAAILNHEYTLGETVPQRGRCLEVH